MTNANEELVEEEPVAPSGRSRQPRFLEIAKRPELGAIGGLLVVILFFIVTADPAMFTAAGFMNVMSPAAQLGILAVGAALLMVSGEFDLSIGSMVAFAGFVF